MQCYKTSQRHQRDVTTKTSLLSQSKFQLQFLIAEFM